MPGDILASIKIKGYSQLHPASTLSSLLEIWSAPESLYQVSHLPIIGPTDQMSLDRTQQFLRFSNTHDVVASAERSLGTPSRGYFCAA